MVGAPRHERPARAVPETTEEHGQEEVPVRAPRPSAISTERDVEIVPEPARERHVPAAPKFRDVGARVGVVEVVRELVPEHERRAPRNVGVSREVAEDLPGVRQNSEPQIGAGLFLRRPEDRVGERAEIVGDDDLLHEPEQGDERPFGGFFGVELLLFGELGQELVRANDWARHEMRKVRNVEEELPDVLRLGPASIEVNHVAQHLERKKRDAEREHELEAGGHARRAEEEVRVLEEHERQEQEHHGDGEVPLLLRRVFCFLDAGRGKIREERHPEDERSVLQSPREVKDVACDEQEWRNELPRQDPPQHEDRSEEVGEQEAVEEHPTGRILRRPAPRKPSEFVSLATGANRTGRRSQRGGSGGLPQERT